MGGGAGGGGGSGDGAGDGDGGGPADGDGNGDGAAGDGSGAGTCGNGTNGSCTNCSSGAAAGDPVDVATGEVFTIPKRDLFLPGYFNLEIERRYSLNNRKHDAGLGWGWTHSLAWEMRIKRDHIEVRSGLGQVVRFAKLEQPGEESATQGWGLLRTPEGYFLRPGNEFFHFFENDREDPECPRLRFISYRSRGSVWFEYERGVLVRIIDTAERAIDLARAPGGQISQLSVTQPGGATLIFARYLYDEAGYLVSAEDADGHRFRYAYDDQGRMSQMETPTGVVFHFAYDEAGRCFETYGVRADGAPDPALRDGLPEMLADGKTKARGIYHAHIDFGEEGYREVADSVRVQRIFSTPSGIVTKALNGRGGCTTRALDSAGNIVAQTDAMGGLWRYLYDHLANVVCRENPEGGTLKFRRDNEGRILEATDPAGGKVLYSRDRNGDIVWMQDPKGGVTRFTYNRRGLMTEHHHADGTTSRFTYDDAANLLSVQLANGALARYEYDYWGRRVADFEPDGTVSRNRYLPSGRLLDVVDNIGRRKAYEYDGLGNITSEQLPDGSTYRYVFGGLGWLTAVIHPNGDVVRGLFNREGWLERIENEAKEIYLREYDATGAMVKETFFDGTWKRYTRDAMSRIVAITDPLGKTAFERNKVGQVIKASAPTGEEVSLAYDVRGELERAATNEVAMEWSRDPLGHIVRERISVGDVMSEVDSERDARGRRTALKTSLGLEQRTPRDPLGRVAEIWAAGERVVAFGRDPVGWPIRRDLPGGGAIVDEQDAVSRTRRRVVLPAGAGVLRDGKPDWVGGPSPDAIDKIYAYTPVDEVACITTPDEGSVEYEYDLRRHLLAKRGREKKEEFRFDSVGNVYETGAGAQPRQYEAGGRLVSRGPWTYQYDVRGRVTEKRVDRDGKVTVTKYRWDAWDMLRGVDLPDGRAIELKYDAFARRVEKRVYQRLPNGKRQQLSNKRYVWDLLSLVHEYEVKSEGPSEVRTFLYEDNTTSVPIAQRRGARGGASEWAHVVGDLNGDPEELVDAAGATIGRSTHDAYGKWHWSAKSRETSPFRFRGQQEDEETGLHYNRYRYYDPETGRYLSNDPIGLAGGLHSYEYGPNPVGWSDPMGWAPHPLTVTSFTDAGNNPIDLGGRTAWVSGEGRQPPPNGLMCPSPLREEALAHSERQLLYHLETNPNTRDRLEGAELQLEGQLPPCINCHRAMHDFAQRHGTTIHYQYGSQTITYQPGHQPQADGRNARAMVHGTSNPNRDHYGPLDGYLHEEGTPYRHGSGGTDGTVGATDRYSYTGTGAPAAYSRERRRVSGR